MARVLLVTRLGVRGQTPTSSSSNGVDQAASYAFINVFSWPIGCDVFCFVPREQVRCAWGGEGEEVLHDDRRTQAPQL